MNPRNIIIEMLKCQFRVSDIDAFMVNGLCDIFIAGLTNKNFERTPNFDDLEEEIIALEEVVLLSNASYDSATIEEDLRTIIVNWWNTLEWARQQVEAEMETEDLMADIVSDIVEEIWDNHNANTTNIRANGGYQLHVLQALLQLHRTGGYTPYKQQRLPHRTTLYRILDDYTRLSKKHNFGDDVHVLLNLLLNKRKRNNKRHASDPFEAYMILCQETGRDPSFNDFLQHRRLKIDPLIFDHVHRLFKLYTQNLKTFRQSSCAFYLMMTSVFDVGRMCTTALAYIMRSGFATDWGISSLVFCKVRLCIGNIFTLNSMTLFCLSVIDQYFATSSHLRWQQWCNIKLAHRLTMIFVIIWILQGIPYIVFYNHIIPSGTNQTICQVTNDIFNQYLSYGYYLTLTNLLQLITVLFGLMAYYNARNLAHRTVPLVRRELDKQLTVMVLVQVLIRFCLTIPFSANNIFALINPQLSDPILQAQINLVQATITDVYISSFASSFYTYVCVSKRFRRQVKYVLFEVPFNRCRPNRIVPNEIPMEIARNASS